MAKFGIPWPCILLVLLLGWTQNIRHDPISFAEFFAGASEQSKALGGLGLQGHTHDITNGACPICVGLECGSSPHGHYIMSCCVARVILMVVRFMHEPIPQRW
jgi:hypothetical protein